MTSLLNRDAVVDHLASTLAERRRTSAERDAAYVKLARAILSDAPLEVVAWSEREAYAPLSTAARAA